MTLQAGLTKSQPLDQKLTDDILKLFYACEVMETLFTDELNARVDVGDDDTTGHMFEAREIARAAKNVVWRKDFPITREIVRETQISASAIAEELSAGIRESKNQF